jgi:hypothetical protein
MRWMAVFSDTDHSLFVRRIGKKIAHEKGSRAGQVASRMWLEFSGAVSGTMKLSDQAATSTS